MRENLTFLGLACVLLVLISNRGAMLIVPLVLFHFYKYYTEKSFTKNVLVSLKESIPIVLPAGLIFLVYHYYHYLEKGWIGYYEESSWAPSFIKEDFIGIINNGLFIGWRLVDFGRIIFIFLTLYLFYRKKIQSFYFLKKK